MLTPFDWEGSLMIIQRIIRTPYEVSFSIQAPLWVFRINFFPQPVGNLLDKTGKKLNYLKIDASEIIYRKRRFHLTPRLSGQMSDFEIDFFGVKEFFFRVLWFQKWVAQKSILEPMGLTSPTQKPGS